MSPGRAVGPFPSPSKHMPNAAFLTPHAVTGAGVGPCTCSQGQWEQGRRQGRAPRCRRTKHSPVAWRERTEPMFNTSSEGEQRKLFDCNLEGKETLPVLQGGVPACSLSWGRARSPSDGQNLSSSKSPAASEHAPIWGCSLSGHRQGPQPVISSPTCSCWTFGSLSAVEDMWP